MPSSFMLSAYRNGVPSIHQSSREFDFNSRPASLRLSGIRENMLQKQLQLKKGTCPRRCRVSAEFLRFIPGAVTSGLEKANEIRKSLVEGEFVSGSPWFGEEDVRILAQQKTGYNDIVVLRIARRARHELAGCTILLLDPPANIHSIYNPYQVIPIIDSIRIQEQLWTNSYYDLFAGMPPIIPEGPIGVLGLAAGTAARILMEVWPWVEIHGWEIDPAVIQVARDYFDMRELEQPEQQYREENNECKTPLESGAQVTGSGNTIMPGFRVEIGERSRDTRSEIFGRRKFVKEQRSLNEGGGGRKTSRSGYLTVHVGDALLEEVRVEGGFSAILVDLFADGVVIPQLQEVATWRALNKRLRPGGRIMVNCGGACVEGTNKKGKDGDQVMFETLQAMREVFVGEVWCQRLDEATGNVVALTGPLPDPKFWEENIPDKIHYMVDKWGIDPIWDGE